MFEYPNDILRLHPELKSAWSANDIGYLLRLGLVRGKKLVRSCKVCTDDVLEIFNQRKKTTLRNY